MPEKERAKRIQDTILRQLNVLDPAWYSKFNVDKIIRLERPKEVYPRIGIRLHTRQDDKAVNVDILYNAGSDLYEVSWHEVDPLTGEVETTRQKRVFAYDLADLIDRKLSKIRKKVREVIE